MAFVPAPLRLSLLLVALAAGVSGCSVSFGSSDKIDAAKAEKLLEDNLRPKPTSVMCPSDVKIVKGGTFTCTFVLRDGRTGTATMHMTNGSGEVRVRNSDIHLQS